MNGSLGDDKFPRVLSDRELRTFGACCAVFLVLYFYELANFTFSIDEELAMYRRDSRIWIAQGRWGAYLVERFIFPHPVQPVVPLAVFGALLAYAMIRFCRLLEIGNAAVCALGFAFIASFPTTFMLAEFSRNIVGAGIAFLGAALCAAWWRRAGVAWAIAFVVCIGAITALYQSAFILAATLCFGVLLIETLHGDSTQGPVFKRALRLAALLLAGLAFYYAVNLAVLAASGVRASYIEKFFNPGFVVERPAFALGRLNHDVQRLYLGLWEGGFDRSYAQFGLTALGAVLCLSALWRRWKHDAALAGWSIALLGALLLAPFWLHALSSHVPYRTMIAAPFVLWLLVIVAWKNARSRALRTLLIGLLALTVFQNWQSLNQFFHAAKLVGLHDQIIAARLSERIEKVLPSVDATESIPLLVVGALPFNNDYSFKGYTATAGSSFFEWDQGQAPRISAYLRHLGLGRFVRADEQTHTKLRSLATTLPPWPAEGSVVYAEKTILIRFPDP